MNNHILTTVFNMSIPNGSLLFVEGGNQIVMSHTKSIYSHVAFLFHDTSKLCVYEAVKPKIRKITWEEYQDEIKNDPRKMSLWIMEPKQPFLDEEINKIKSYCEQQIGRPYSIGSYISATEKRGIHCGEMTVRGLMLANIIPPVKNACRETPASVKKLAEEKYQSIKKLD